MSFDPLDKPGIPPAPPIQNTSCKTLKAKTPPPLPESIGNYFMTCCGFRKPPKTHWIELALKPLPPPTNPISECARIIVEKAIKLAIMHLSEQESHVEEQKHPLQNEETPLSIADRLNKIVFFENSSDEKAHITADKATRHLDKIIKKLPEYLDFEDF